MWGDVGFDNGTIDFHTLSERTILRYLNLCREKKVQGKRFKLQVQISYLL